VKTDRKEAIRSAAIDLFATRGFHATPTSDVAKKAGVSEGIIFYHFHTKEGILMSLFMEVFEDYYAGMKKEIEKDSTGLDALAGCIRLQSAKLREKPREALLLVRDLPASFADPDSPFRLVMKKHISEVTGLLQKAIQKGQRDGSIRVCDAEKGALVVLQILIGMSRLSLEGFLPVPELTEETVDFCRRAFAARN